MPCKGCAQKKKKEAHSSREASTLTANLEGREEAVQCQEAEAERAKAAEEHAAPPEPCVDLPPPAGESEPREAASVGETAPPEAPSVGDVVMVEGANVHEGAMKSPQRLPTQHTEEEVARSPLRTTGDVAPVTPQKYSFLFSKSFL